MPGPPPARQADDAVARFVRGFGLHHPQYTADGQPVSMATACVLAELRKDGPLRQFELGRRLGLGRSNISHTVAQLVLRGWLHRESPTGDRRGVLVGLSEQGKRVADQLAEARRERFELLLARIPPDRHDAILDTLTLIAEAAQGYPAPIRSGP